MKMAALKSIEIRQFRSIKELTISDFSKINLVVGDNNSGKTTLLEAIQLLFTKAQLSAVRNVINQRTVLQPSKNSFYTSFIKMFNMEQNGKYLECGVFANTDKGTQEFELQGFEKIITGDDALQVSLMSARQKEQYKRANAVLPEQVKMFEGSIISDNGKKTMEKKIRFTSLDNIIAVPMGKKEVYYIPSFGHLRYDLIQNIVDNPDYKKLAIKILKQFDETIMDICYTKDDDGSYVETIITENGVNMPFSVYGDGIKKILFILNRMFDAVDSILLIDEIETGLHKKYYDMLFPVVFALAEKLNVQLFITTHSIEVIDAILRYGDYGNNKENKDPIKVITLKKIIKETSCNIVARNITGRYAYENRQLFEFEVRL